MIRFRSQLFVLAILYSAISVYSQQLQKEFSGVQIVDIKTVSGNCILKRSESDTLSVELDHNITGNFYPSAEQAGSKLTIIEKHGPENTRGDAFWTLTIPGNLKVKFNSASGSFEVSDSEGSLNINTSSGNIEIEDYSGNVELNSASGNVKLKGVSGEIHVRTASGRIKCSDASSTGEGSFNSGSGDIEMENYKGNLKASTGSGDIRLDSVVGKIRARSGSGNVKSKKAALSGESQFSSGSGDAEVHIAKPLNHNISVSSGSGDSVLDFNGIKISGELTMIANKKNGRIKAPFKFDRTEEVDQGNQVKIKKSARLGNSDIKIELITGSGTSEIVK